MKFRNGSSINFGIGKSLLGLSLVFLSYTETSAQVGTSATVAYDMPSEVTTAVLASSLTHRVWLDSSNTPIQLTPTCTAVGTAVSCSTPLPALTVGNHTLAITIANSEGESDRAPIPPLSFTVIVKPNPVKNVRIVRTTVLQ